jgi:hypothetical protein
MRASLGPFRVREPAVPIAIEATGFAPRNRSFGEHIPLRVWPAGHARRKKLHPREIVYYDPVPIPKT